MFSLRGGYFYEDKQVEPNKTRNSKINIPSVQIIIICMMIFIFVYASNDEPSNICNFTNMICIYKLITSKITKYHALSNKNDVIIGRYVIHWVIGYQIVMTVMFLYQALIMIWVVWSNYDFWHCYELKYDFRITVILVYDLYVYGTHTTRKTYGKFRWDVCTTLRNFVCLIVFGLFYYTVQYPCH